MDGKTADDDALRDPWHGLRHLTAARIALGRVGASLPTSRVLEFSLAHALARDAVQTPLDRDADAAEIAGLGLATMKVSSRAESRSDYLRRPDLGRLPAAADLERISREGGTHDICLIVADGLSSRAVAANAAAFIAALLPGLQRLSLGVSPVPIVRNGRVAIGDPIGQAFGARLTVMLIGERPGLSSSDSLGCYLTFDPTPGRVDAQRNCISNIRENGLRPQIAAHKALWLVQAALQRRLTGVRLKDESGPLLEGGEEGGAS
jgi:ethanolamine ammonia-lyase small subunit